MNKVTRIIFLILLLSTSIALIGILVIRKIDTPLNATLVPFFTYLLQPVKDAEIASTHLLPIDEMDEKAFGEIISSYYEKTADKNNKNYIYANNILSELIKSKTKSFNYHIYIINETIPNAFAYPGGVIIITEGLFDILDSEAELSAIISHEMGHIELGHCFQAIKYQLLAKKVDMEFAGEIADFLNSIFLRYSYTKIQEAEADLYSFNKIKNTKYTPSAVAGAFYRLKQYEISNFVLNNSNEIDPIRDYFLSHPPLRLRIEKYNNEAMHWWKSNHNKKRYIGVQNLKEKTWINEKRFENEWINKHNNYK